MTRTETYEIRNTIRQMMADWDDATPEQRHDAQIKAALSAASPDDLARLRNLAEQISDRVCSVHGYVTREQADAHKALVRATGLDYDAINGRWVMPEDADV